MKRVLPVLALLLLAAPGARADVAEGNRLMGRAKYAEALPHFEAALQADENDVPALYGASYCLTALSQQAGQDPNDLLWRAEPLLTRLVEKAPAVALYRFLRGWSCFLLGRVALSYTRPMMETAEKELEAATGLKADHMDAWFYLAQVRERRQRWAPAAEAWRKVLALNPNLPQYYPRIATCYLHVGRYDDALGACRIGLAKGPSPKVALSLRKLKANAHAGLGQVDDAVAEYRHVLAAAPDDEASYKALWTILGGDMARCETVFGALAKGPDPKGLAAMYYVSALAANKKTEKHRAVLATVVKRHPDGALFWYWHGQAEMAAGEAERAYGAYLKALEADPNYTYAYQPLLERFDALTREGKYAEAVALQKRILAAENKKGRPLADIVAWVNHEMAYNLFNLGRFDEADQALEKAVKYLPTEPRFHNTRGLLLRARGRDEEACKAFRAAMDIFPDYMFSMENLAVTLFTMGKVAEAKKILDAALTAAGEQLLFNPERGVKAERTFDLFKFKYFLTELREVERAEGK